VATVDRLTDMGPRPNQLSHSLSDPYPLFEVEHFASFPCFVGALTHGKFRLFWMLIYNLLSRLPHI
jgi:hypothetical protein